MENQLIIDPVEKTPEQIEADMQRTRESLTEKVAALETQVLGTVQTAANTLTDTVDAVKSFVHTAPTTVSDTVDHLTSAVREKMEKTFDVSGCIQEHPWSAVGTSLVCGFLASSLLFRGGRPRSESIAAKPVDAPLHPHPFSAPGEPRMGIFDDLIGMVGRKLKEMAETAIESASASLNKHLQDGIPKVVDEASKRLKFEDREYTGQSFDASSRIYGR